MAKDMADIIKESIKKGTSPYDTEAEVRRIEDGVAWVHIPGGVDETPVNLTMNAKKGDIVQVRVAGGRAWLTGNGSSPPTDDTTALIADSKAVEAKVDALKAKEDARSAHDAAIAAMADAEVAHTAATEAKADAVAANTAANEAKADALVATKAANGALTQLSVVEDVAGVLNWIQDHGSYVATTDTEVAPGKLYFLRSGDDYDLVTNPTGNPSENNYYELVSVDETVANYVTSHLSLTNAGLWVVKDNNGYKILLANDGMKVYDAQGNLVSTFGQNITFSGSRSQYIGGEDAYIVFDASNGTISIGGTKVNINANVTVGGQSRNLSQVITDMQAEIDGAIETWYYDVDPTTSNPPASTWATDDEKQIHLRDLYFNTTNGHSFRWALDNGVYKWIQIEDTDLATLAADLSNNYVTKDQTVTNVTIEYAKSTSPSVAPESGWSSTTPEWEEGKYIWQRTDKVINGVHHYTYACIQGAKGETGSSGEDATVLRIDSSRGTVFKNNAVATMLTVTIYSGSDRITNITDLRSKFGNGAYLQWYWQRLDDSDYGVIVSTDHKLSNDGFSLTLTPEEVDTKVTFRCELIV